MQDAKSINIRKSIAFLESNNKPSKKKIKKTISFRITSKRINLAKEVEDLYIENYTILLKESLKDTNK